MDYADVKRGSMTCRRFRAILTSDVFWTGKTRADYGSGATGVVGYLLSRLDALREESQVDFTKDELVDIVLERTGKGKKGERDSFWERTNVGNMCRSERLSPEKTDFVSSGILDPDFAKAIAQQLLSIDRRQRDIEFTRRLVYWEAEKLAGISTVKAPSGSSGPQNNHDFNSLESREWRAGTSTFCERRSASYQ